MPNFLETAIEGVMLFDLLPNGCINAVSVNFDTNEVLNEISKKMLPKDEVSVQHPAIEGFYHNLYFNREHNSDIDDESGTLNISKNAENHYVLNWIAKDNLVYWTGKGWLIKPNQMLVVFWPMPDPKQPFVTL